MGGMEGTPGSKGSRAYGGSVEEVVEEAIGEVIEMRIATYLCGIGEIGEEESKSRVIGCKC